jgi:hypothetical protein
MTTRGETTYSSAEGASKHVNLSGKRTLVRRSSGECLPFRISHQRGKPTKVNFQVQGQRPSYQIRG